MVFNHLNLSQVLHGHSANPSSLVWRKRREAASVVVWLFWQMFAVFCSLTVLQHRLMDFLLSQLQIWCTCRATVSQIPPSPTLGWMKESPRASTLHLSPPSSSPSPSSWAPSTVYSTGSMAQKWNPSSSHAPVFTVSSWSSPSCFCSSFWVVWCGRRPVQRSCRDTWCCTGCFLW